MYILRIWPTAVALSVSLSTRTFSQNQVRVTEISETEARRLMERKWRELEAYKTREHKLQCTKLPTYVSGVGCADITDRYACQYRLGNMTLTDVSSEQKVIQWQNTATEYSLPSGIKIYELQAAICEGRSGMGSALIEKRLYNSKDGSFWKGTNSPRALPFYELVSPDGKVLVIVQRDGVTVWNLEKSKFMSGGQGIDWIPQLFVSALIEYPCGSPQIYSVRGRPNACIYTVDIKEFDRPEMPCIQSNQKYYLLSW